jgi:hypothetical protein
VDIGRFLRNACLLNHVHGRWTSSNNYNIRGWQFRRISNLVVVLDWERRGFLTRELRNIFMNIVAPEVRVSIVALE